MASQSLEELFARAAEIAKGVPKNLQEVAFNRALDQLMGTKPIAHDPPSKRAHVGKRHASSGDKPNKMESDSLIEKIDRTRHADVGQTTRLADRALKVLELALHEHNVDGLTSSDISEILTRKFRLPAKPNAVGMALNREHTTVNVRREHGKLLFHIMQPGEDYLRGLREQSAAGRAQPSTGRSVRTSGRQPKADSKPEKRTKTRKKVAGKKPAPGSISRKATTGRIGPKAAIERLLVNGYFSGPRGIANIQQQLKHTLGYDFSVQELSPSLVRLLRGGQLKRDRNESNQYEYYA
jgi:hypothetical protein